MTEQVNNAVMTLTDPRKSWQRYSLVILLAGMHGWLQTDDTLRLLEMGVAFFFGQHTTQAGGAR